MVKFTYVNIERKTTGNMSVLYFSLMRFHIVHQDDPSFSSITQRFSSECHRGPRTDDLPAPVSYQNLGSLLCGKLFVFTFCFLPHVCLHAYFKRIICGLFKPQRCAAACRSYSTYLFNWQIVANYLLTSSHTHTVFHSS